MGRSYLCQKKQKIFILALLIALSGKNYSQEIIPAEIKDEKTLTKETAVSDLPSEEELNFMKAAGMISEEDYLILLDEIRGVQEEELNYSLNIDGLRAVNGYKMQNKENKVYFPLYSFLEAINLTNYETKENSLLLKLGDSLREVEINFDKKAVKTESFSYPFEDRVFEEEGEIYIEAELFTSIFLKEYIIHKDRYVISMNLNFTAPKDIVKRLDLKKEELNQETEENELMYTNTPHLFDLGYARIELEKMYSKTKDNGEEHDWSGNVEYQGDVLFGSMTTSLDLKEKKIGNTEIEYPDIWKEHILRIGNYTAGDVSREWGLSFKKDKGYYSSNKKYIIRERVPIGSRVELIYMGFVLEIQDAEEGVVEFNNPEIKSDRTYELKIYSPDGKIEVRKIDTAEDYNQQNKNEVEYDVNIREDHESGKVTSDLNIFYGVTDNLTTGGTYKREVEEIDGSFEYINSGRGELIYSNYIRKYPYVLTFGGEKTFDNYNTEDKNYEDRYSYDTLGEIKVDDWKFTVQRENFGKYYDEKTTDTYEVQYSINNWGTVSYEYEKSKMYSGEIEKDSNISMTVSKTYKSLMTTLDYSQKRSGDKEFGVNFYYTGFDKFSTRWENRWVEENGDTSYETEVTLYNNNYRGKFDYSLSAGYSEKYKDKITLNFTVRLDDWLEFGGDVDRGGNQRYTAGIDKVVDLQNVRKKVTNMDVSRVKVITFIDENNNNVYDKGEKKVPDVEVSIGKDKIITDEHGEGMFYGISNSIVYDINPRIKKPSFSQGNNKIKIKGRTSSTIEAYIPIKPMVTLSGKIEFDKILDLEEDEKQEIYNEILIRIMDLKGNEIELTMPDNTGEFDVSGLFPEEYKIEIMYTGIKYDIKSLDEKIALAYEDEEDTRITFKMSDKLISMNEKEK